MVSGGRPARRSPERKGVREVVAAALDLSDECVSYLRAYPSLAHQCLPADGNSALCTDECAEALERTKQAASLCKPDGVLGGLVELRVAGVRLIEKGCLASECLSELPDMVDQALLLY